MKINCTIEPDSRNILAHTASGDEVPAFSMLSCQIRLDDGNRIPAAVTPCMSITAKQIFPEDEQRDGMQNGRLRLLHPARAFHFRLHPFFNEQFPVTGEIEINCTLKNADGTEIDHGVCSLSVDNADVTTIRDWTRVLQEMAIGEGAEQWRFSPEFGLHAGAKHQALPLLSYPLNLTGMHAVFVALPPGLGAIELRFSGDEKYGFFQNVKTGSEIQWRIVDLTRQHLVIRQPYRTCHQYEEDYLARLAYVRFVPLSSTDRRSETKRRAVQKEKLVVCYNEPYSWAFDEKITESLQHRVNLTGFAEAGASIVDVNIGRIGMKYVFETRYGDQLLYETHGDEVRGQTPTTENVGRMQQFTNVLSSQLKYARELGMTPHVNFGATRCYAGSKLQGDFSREHPEWIIGDFLDYRIPAVRNHALAILRESLEIGARGVSVDWCRYPRPLQSEATPTLFLREIRALLAEFENEQCPRIPLLVRFPAEGIDGNAFMDYSTWIREELVDLLCPSMIYLKGRNFNIEKYAEATRGKQISLLPAISGDWHDAPGSWLARAHYFYEQGADGVYIYQSDFIINTHYQPELKRHLPLLGSAQAVADWLMAEQAAQTQYAKRIFLLDVPGGQYGTVRPIVVWIDGLAPTKVEFLLDNKKIAECCSAPWQCDLSSPDNGGPEPGTYTLKVVARTKERELCQSWPITIA